VLVLGSTGPIDNIDYIFVGSNGLGFRNVTENDPIFAREIRVSIRCGKVLCRNQAFLFLTTGGTGGILPVTLGSSIPNDQSESVISPIFPSRGRTHCRANIQLSDDQ
jgi:hypothetical protein